MGWVETTQLDIPCQLIAACGEVPSVPACVAQNLGFSPPSPGVARGYCCFCPHGFFFPKNSVISCYIECSYIRSSIMFRWLLSCTDLDFVQSQGRAYFSLNQRFWPLTFLVCAAMSNARRCPKSTAILATQRDSEDVLEFSYPGLYSLVPNFPPFKGLCFFYFAHFWMTSKKHLRFLLSCSRFSYNGGFLKWWYPTTMRFPTKNNHFMVFWGTTI